MQVKNIVMLVVAGSAIGLLTGCGIPEEEYNAKVGELNTAWAEIDTLKAKITDGESQLKAEQAKVRTARIELDDAAERMKALQLKESKTAEDLTSAKAEASKLKSENESAAKLAEGRVAALTKELNALKEEYNGFKERLLRYKENLQASGGIGSVYTQTSGSSSKTAVEVLNDMSNK